MFLVVLLLFCVSLGGLRIAYRVCALLCPVSHVHILRFFLFVLSSYVVFCLGFAFCSYCFFFFFFGVRFRIQDIWHVSSYAVFIGNDLFS